MAGIELEGDEIRPTLALSAEEVAALEAERESMRGTTAFLRKSDKQRIRGEGTALEPEPVNVVSIRSRLEAQRAAAGEPVLVEATAEDRVRFVPNGETITADPEVLGRLVLAAQKAQGEAAEYRSLCDAAEAEATETRAALHDYLKAHGLA